MIDPTYEQFAETLFEMLDELDVQIVYLYHQDDLEDFKKLLSAAWERAKTQRV